MKTSELLKFMTPAEQGVIAACVDDVDLLGDDDACEALRDSMYLNASLDLDWAAASRMAYTIIHECKRV